MKKTVIITKAEIPPELEQAWLQHMRDFDTAHKDCHFVVLADSQAKETMEEMKAKFCAVTPGFRFMQVFERGKRGK